MKQRVHEPLAETLQDPGAILLVSSYELGHQPLGLASPLGFLEREGFTPEVLDIAVERSPAGMDCQGSRKDVLAEIVRAAGIAFRPTWVAFTPWTTLEDYLDVLEFVEAEGLIDHVDAVQWKRTRRSRSSGCASWPRPWPAGHAGEAEGGHPWAAGAGHRGSPSRGSAEPSPPRASFGPLQQETAGV